MRSRSILLLPFLLFFLNLLIPSARARIVVNTTVDDDDPDPFDGICDTGSGSNLTGLCTYGIRTTKHVLAMRALPS
jgi:hypothetical protein